MRIILDYRPALRERTGVGEYVHELALALAEVRREGPNDHIVAFSSSWRDRLDPAPLQGLATIDARVPVRLLNFLWHRLEWPPVERLAGSADIAHSAHPLLMPARAAAQVVTIHDLDFLEHPERTGAEIRRDYPRLARRHAHRADLVVVSSRHTAQAVSTILGVPEERIVFCPAGGPSWARRPGAPGSGYLLFVGTLEPRKNVGVLLDAYERLVARRPDSPPLRLAGKATDAAAPWLARLSRPPLAGRATHLGYVDEANRRALYEGAAALVVPSLHEGFGLTALEAMTVGVPVIAARRGSLPEVLGDAALFVEPDDPEGLTEAMRRVVEDPGLARDLAEAGRRRAGTFSWRRSAETLRSAYDDALARRRAR